MGCFDYLASVVVLLNQRKPVLGVSALFWVFLFFLSYFQNSVTSLCVMSILGLLIVYWIQLPADNRLLKDNSSVYLFFIKERTIFWWEFKVSFDLDNETARLNIKIVCKARIQIRKYSLLLKEFQNTVFDKQ